MSTGTAKDPIGFEGESPNLYVYAGNDPVALIDPDGSIAILPILAAGALWAGADLLWQHFIQGRDLECVNWARVAIAGALGGTLKGVQGSVALARWAWMNPGVGFNSRLFGIGVKYTKGILNTTTTSSDCLSRSETLYFPDHDGGATSFTWPHRG